MEMTELHTLYADAPDAILAFFDAESVTEIHIGCSSTRVYRIQAHSQTVYLKTHPLSSFFSFGHEVSVLEWLKGQLPVPCVHEYARDTGHEYLILSEVPGDNGVDAMKRLDGARLVALLAQGLRKIHRLTIARCPFDERVASKLKRARYHVQHGLVDEVDFDDERLGMSAEEVYQALQRGRPPEEELVFNHGDYCLPNILLEDERVGGFIDLSRAGISDKYNDLAIASRSIRYNLGPDYEPLFFAEYGMETVDEEKIQYYRKMDELF
jgi:aminoglycoside phosphotransferase